MGAHLPEFWRRRGALALALLPLAGVFAALAALRRTAYQCEWLKPEVSDVPVIVVGNIAVGGSGKTPVVQWLIDVLRAAGFTPGIVSRGHGGSERGPVPVPADGDAARFGDEPVLLARATAAPLVIGRDRPAAVRRLLEAHPQCDVVVADDGLQHYRLARRIEIVVVDEFQLGNRLRLPAGPLREGLSRLGEADLVFAHGPLSVPVRSAAGEVPVFDMTLQGDELVSIDGARRVALAHFAGRRVHAIAGIGRPQRFFAQLARAGLEVVEHAFPDHHAYRAEDLAMAPGEPRILTAKDAVKCAAFAPPDTWVLPVRACIDAAASQLIVEKLTHGIPPA